MLPSNEPVVKPLFDEWLLARQAEEGPKPTAMGTLLRMSQAGACARQIAFQATGTPVDYELDAQILFTFDVGNVWHDRIQTLVIEHLDAETEVPCTLEPEYPVSGSADFVYGDYVGEIKTVAGYGYGLAVGDIWQEEGPGPKIEHIAQVGMYARALGKGNIHIIYINKDKQGIAEWFYNLGDSSGAFINEMVDEELARMKGIAGRIESGMWPKRTIPGYGVVANPPPYMAKKGDPWNCRYCRWRDTCSTLPPEATPMLDIDTVQTRIKELMK